MSEKLVVLNVELTAAQAAALARLCEKFSHTDAKAYLYPHIPNGIRDNQAYEMVQATAVVFKALTEVNVRGWPWVDTGFVS